MMTQKIENYHIYALKNNKKETEPECTLIQI